MVKITQAINIDELIKKGKEKCAQIEKIAQDIWGEEKIHTESYRMYIRPETDPSRKTRVFIGYLYNHPEVTVFDKDYYNDAMKFAKTYEKIFKQEVTLTVDY